MPDTGLEPRSPGYETRLLASTPTAQCEQLMPHIQLTEVSYYKAVFVVCTDYTRKYQSYPYTTPGALFRKSMLLDRDFLNSAPRLYKENSSNPHNKWAKIIRPQDILQRYQIMKHASHSSKYFCRSYSTNNKVAVIYNVEISRRLRRM